MSSIKIIQIKSHLGRKKDQHSTLLGLGLRRIRDVSILKSTPEVMGMVNKVQHLVSVEVLNEAQ